jgi:putative membrane protein
MGLLISWLVLSVAVWVTAAVLPGFKVKDFKSAVIVALIFGLLNSLLGWLLFAVFTVATLGLAWLLAFLTWWLINTLILMLTDRLTDHLKIESFRWALLGALAISLVSAVVRFVLRI